MAWVNAYGDEQKAIELMWDEQQYLIGKDCWWDK
jgi:hypothetical protein